MNPFSSSDLDSRPHEDTASNSSTADDDLPATDAPYGSVMLTGGGAVTALSDVSSLSEEHVGQNQVQSLDEVPTTPAPSPDLLPTCRPDTDPVILPSSCFVSISLSPSPAPPRCFEETCPDLECSICFSEFNNVFRCPKMLHCRHTFCLECLARINVKSAEPGAIYCPLCRSLTQLPTLGPPRLPTDSTVLSSLPAAMQRVYSVRFNRNKGKLQVKRSSEGHQGWSLRASRLTNRSLNVGFPSPRVVSSERTGGVGSALFRLTDRPVCRAVLLTSMIVTMALLTGIVIFLLTFNIDL